MKQKVSILQFILLFGLMNLSCNLPQRAAATETALPLIAITDTPVPTPTATPIATPEPKTSIENADEALFYGDWERALQLYLAASTDSSIMVQSAAHYGIARIHYVQEDYSEALSALSILINQYPAAPERAYAFFLMGESFSKLDRYAEAAQSYQEYINSHPGLIDQYAFERKGDMLFALSDYQNAINAYHQALLFESINRSLLIRIKIGDSYMRLGDYETAIVLYQDTLLQTGNDYIKAQMYYSIGTSYLALGETEAGYSAMHQTVNEYPFAYNSYLALLTLVDNGIAVNELNRGIIDYTVGQYAVAISALDRYMNAVPEHEDTAHHYKALSLQITGQYEAAIAEWNELIEAHPDGRYYSAAFDEIAYTQWAYIGDYDAAIKTYENFIKLAPTHTDAGELLYYAGRTAERSGDLYKAAQIWQRVGIEYSLSQYGFNGFFQAGISRYRLRDFSAAQDDFQSTLGLAANAAEQAQAYFWIGKAQYADGNTELAAQSWIQAISIDPTGYYSERSEDILYNVAPFTTTAYNFEINVQGEKAEAEAWLITTFLIPPETNFNDTAPLASHPEFIRGTELWELGLYESARLEFESLRSKITSNPLKNYLLTNYLVDLGLYRSAIFSARQILNLAGYDDASTLQGPIYLNRIRFGLYYDSLVFPAAQGNSFDPLFVYSVIRQESLFEGFVTSSAGARGLMQIIPATGDLIHRRSGWPEGYTSEDLYRPVINIPFGIDYLSSQKNGFGGDLYVALAAYNGGPGNAAVWQQLAGYDPDLFVEVVRFSETRRYLKSIYEIHEIYKMLYQSAVAE